jgi:ClpP class serine protease
MASIAHHLMGSAAYWLGAQADEIIASPSASVGWIGAVAIHSEHSKADEQEGITTTVIRHPEGKFGGNSHEPLSDKARAELQMMVDDMGTMFENDVAKARGVTPATVRSDYGQGGGMTAARAKAAGLVDRVATYDETLARLATGKVRPRIGLAATVEPVLGKVYLHQDDGTDEEVPEGAEATLTSTEGEPLPPIEETTDNEGEPDVELALLRAKNRGRTR